LAIGRCGEGGMTGETPSFERERRGERVLGQPDWLGRAEEGRPGEREREESGCGWAARSGWAERAEKRE
jgi:hypothetical protein